jgi:dihydrofolate synthase/folylpolyglutamate synthase
VSFFDSYKEYAQMRPGLDRISAFMRKLKDPQNSFKSIQVAGTNAKGSCASFLANILYRHGYKTGLYTSPHLVNIYERIKINGDDISASRFNYLTKKLEPLAHKFKLSYFEFLTAIAFVYFADEGVDFVVAETGLGGRLDATNILNSAAAVITTISYDHTEILGKTLKEIAYEKAGIIKGGAKVICGALEQEALSVIEKNKRAYVYGRDFFAENLRSLDGFYEFDYSGKSSYKNLILSIAGLAQTQNASIAISVCEQLSVALDENKLKDALKKTKWPARFDIRKINGRTFIVDGGHNIEAINNFLKNWDDAGFDKSDTAVIFAMMAEKDFKTAARLIGEKFNFVLLPKISSQRALSPQILKQEFIKYMPAENIVETANIDEAMRLSCKKNIVVVLGSFYLAGEFLDAQGRGKKDI